MFRRPIGNSKRRLPSLAGALHRGPCSLPHLQVFHDLLLFLTFLPPSAARSRQAITVQSDDLGIAVIIPREPSFAIATGGRRQWLCDEQSSNSLVFFAVPKLAVIGSCRLQVGVGAGISFCSSECRIQISLPEPSRLDRLAWLLLIYLPPSAQGRQRSQERRRGLRRSRFP
jgi:hypothetical protein